MLCFLSFWPIALERLNELSSFLKQHLRVDQDNYTAPTSLMLGFTPYRFSEPPARLKKARLDNIALVPASLLSLKGAYTEIANRLPTGSVLVVPGTQRQQKIMAKVTSFFRDHGRQVITMPLENITRKIKKTPQPLAEDLRLAI